MLKKRFLLPLLTLCLFFVMGIGVMAAEEDMYYYNETPAEKVKVKVTLSYDGVPLMAQDGKTILGNLDVEVPYFDLAEYGLEYYYRYYTDENKDYVQKKGVVERPTGLHLYIYLIERYYLGLDEEWCGTGATAGMVMGEVPNNVTEIKNMWGDVAYEVGGNAPLTLADQAPCSLFMTNFWGFRSNLNYYVNHIWPLWKEGGNFGGSDLWRTGATVDYILLDDGDVVEVAMFDSNDFTGSASKGFAYFPEKEYTIRDGETLTIDTVYRAKEGSYCLTDQLSETPASYDCFALDKERNVIYPESVNDGNSVAYTFDEPGEYSIYALESGLGTSGKIASCDPAVAKVIVKEAPTKEVQAVIDMINALGTVEYTESYKAKLDAVKAAYEALSEEEKALLLNAEIKAIEKAEKDYTALEEAAQDKTEENPDSEDTSKDDANTSTGNGSTGEANNPVEIPKEESNTETLPKDDTTSDEEQSKGENAVLEAQKKAVHETKIASLKAKKYKTTGVKLTWKKNSDLDGYEIERSTKKNSGYKLVTSVTAAKYTLKKGLNKNKTYYYRVRGYKVIDGEKAYTPYTRIIVNLNQTKAVKTITIDSVMNTISGKKVTLTWDKPESMYSLKGYKVYQSTKQKSGFKLVKTAKSEKVTIKNLKKGKTYYFKLQGYAKVSKKTVNTKAKTVKVKMK